MRKLKIAVFIAIIVLGFILRLYRFDNPLADWHSWRQVDTSAVSRNFVEKGYDLLHPRFDDLSNVPSSGRYDNLEGYRFVEFPIYNVFQAGLYSLFGFLTLEEWGRLVTIFTSLLSVALIFLIVRRHAGDRAAFIASFFFSVLPFSVYYGRVVLPDSMTSTAILGAIYFFDVFIENPKKWSFFLLSFIFLSLAFLLKPFAIFFTLPILFLVFNKYGREAFKKKHLWVYAIGTIIPLALWRIWMLQYPQGIPEAGWLFNGNQIRFKGAFFYWIFADRISRLILGYFGIVFLIMGFLIRLKRSDFLFFLSFVASSLLYVVVMASGNVQHDYYQILIIPTIAIFAGLGGEFLLSFEASRLIKYPLFAVIAFFSIFFSWYHVRDYYNINNPSIVRAGKIIDEMTPKDARIIAIYNGDTTFLYHTKRQGWASFSKDITDLMQKGADYLALPNPTKLDFNFSDAFKIIYSSEELLLYDLHKKP